MHPELSFFLSPVPADFDLAWTEPRIGKKYMEDVGMLHSVRRL